MKCKGVLAAFALLGLYFFPLSLRAQAGVITEFLASNRDGLLDEDGTSSDWIEIQNQGATAVNLEGWYLTDDADEMQRWRFPSVEVLPGSYLLVFASGKDRAVPGSELHANFRLEGDGEFLALVEPGGVVAHAFTPSFPPQRPNVSYGFSQRAARADYILAGSAGRLWVPDDGRLGDVWTEAAYDDSWWAPVESGVGFATGDWRAPPAMIENVALVGRATNSSFRWGVELMRVFEGNTN